MKKQKLSTKFSSPPTALAAPTTATVLIDRSMLDDVCHQARNHPRRRMLLPLHRNQDAQVHRMLNGLQPDSYIRPHRHLDPPKSESIIVLQGAIATIIFDHFGNVTATHLLTAGSSVFGIDIEAGLFHTFVARQPDSVIFEIKPGPYVQATDKDFATWAPPDNSPMAKNYLAALHSFLVK